MDRSELPSTGSVTLMIQQLKAGDDKVTFELVDRYFEHLQRIAAPRLAGMHTAAKDEQDVALSAMRCLIEKAQDGEFDQLTDRDDLWKLLIRLTVDKARDVRKHENRLKRGGGQVRCQTDIDKHDEFASNVLEAQADEAKTPDEIRLLAELWDHAFAALHDDPCRQIAELYLLGKTYDEIAKSMGCSRATVDRRLRMIREEWESLGTKLSGHLH